jgi:hypothetical protein
MKVLAAPALFLICLGLGIWVTDHSWDGQLFVFVGEQRSPAAVRSLVDFSSIERSALYRSAHKQVFAGAEVVKLKGYAGIRLGHPVISKGRGAKAFGCQVPGHNGMFDQIELTFVGVGISESGGQPRMIVGSPCRALKDLNRLETVWIPMGDIFASQPKDQELQIFGKSPVSVRLMDIPGQWPQEWVLWSARLYRSDNAEKPLVMDARLLKEARPQMLSFDWKPAAVQ